MTHPFEQEEHARGAGKEETAEELEAGEELFSFSIRPCATVYS